MTSADIAPRELSGKTNSSEYRAESSSLEHVYAIAAIDGAVKIGSTSDLEKRLAAASDIASSEIRRNLCRGFYKRRGFCCRAQGPQVLPKQRISGGWFRVSNSESGEAISKAADEIRTQQNLRDMERREYHWSISPTPRTYEMQGGTQKLSHYKREASAWDFARQLERSYVRVLQRKRNAKHDRFLSTIVATRQAASRIPFTQPLRHLTRTTTMGTRG